MHLRPPRDRRCQFCLHVLSSNQRREVPLFETQVLSERVDIDVRAACVWQVFHVRVRVPKSRVLVCLRVCVSSKSACVAWCLSLVPAVRRLVGAGVW